MSTEMQTKVQASPVQNFTPVQTGLLQIQSALCNTPGLVEDSGQDQEKLTLQRGLVDQAGTTTVPPILPRFGHDFSRVSMHSNGPGMIQAKLKINEPGDIYEQEADRVAEQVMRMPEPGVQRDVEPEWETLQSIPLASQIVPLVQRQPADEDEEKEEEIQAKPLAGQTPEVTPAISSGIQSLQGGGRPLSKSESGFFEPRFRADFSDVRVHSDARAANVARSVNARAFTLGHDVAFGAGEFSSNTLAGRKLLAHELTHVVQQNGGSTVFSASKNSENKIPNFQRLGIMSLEFEQETSANIHSPNRFGIKANVPDSSSLLQRVADKSNPPSNLPCDRIDSGSGGPVGTHVVFEQREQILNTELIEAEFKSWVSRGRIDSITVDGFASSEGSAKVNWRLSCSRAEVVKAEFVRLGVPSTMLTTIGHGETEEFSAAQLPPNRRAVIRIVPTQQIRAAPGCLTTITENTTLTDDCPNGIVIAADNVVLNCAGHTLTGGGGGFGISLSNRTGVRVVNCHVTNFINGFDIRNSSSANTFTNNSSFNNTTDGFDINTGCNENIFIQNNANDNNDHGFELDGCSNNLFIQNTANGNVDGYDTEGPFGRRDGVPAPNNIFVYNIADRNRESGFRILSNGNTLSGNSSTNSVGNRNGGDGYGYRIQGNTNVLGGNVGSSNVRDGFRIQGNSNVLGGNVGSSNVRDGFRIQGNSNTLIGNSGNGNQSQDVDVRNNTTGNTCTGNTFGTTNGSCLPDF